MSANPNTAALTTCLLDALPTVFLGAESEAMVRRRAAIRGAVMTASVVRGANTTSGEHTAATDCLVSYDCGNTTLQ